VNASHNSSLKTWVIGTGEGVNGWETADSLLKVVDSLPKYPTLNKMILKRVRVLLEIGDTMRLLCCLLLLWSVLLSGCGESKEDATTPIKKLDETVTLDTKAQTTKESQDAAVAAIKELGGKITFDEKNPDKPVVAVDLSHSSTKATDLVHLKGLTSLQTLDLNGTEVTDAGLVHLEGLKSLQELRLLDTQVTHDGLSRIGEWLSKAAAVGAIKELGGQVFFDEKNPGKPLVGVDLSQSKVTDAGLVDLMGMTNLQRLDLRETKVTDAGLVHLKGLTSLQLLNLSDTKVTDAKVTDAKVTDAKVTDAKVTDAKVTDAGLEHLKRLTSLHTLYLNGTEVTDTGLDDLKRLTSLEYLSLQKTKVTTAGVEDLQSALPKCLITK
jgi:uncharacterized protein YjbI with pentapeptide repeats